MVLAKKINLDYKNDIVLVSLARAGTPVGVILARILREHFNRNVVHYTVSIIRDKGLDLNALRFIVENHESSSIAFIDGWTGKGVIGKELKKSVTSFNNKEATVVSPNLYVVTDISGTAYWSASSEDYLIPSAVLNSTISGLVSRTIMLKNHMSNDDFHGCLFYNDLLKSDISQWFVDEIMLEANLITEENIEYVFQEAQKINKIYFQLQSSLIVEKLLSCYNINNNNYIKPGIGESTRVLLRRLPRDLIVKDMSDINIQHLLHLCKEKNISVRVDSNICYNCIAIIELVD